MSIILGIDPGSLFTGFGAIRIDQRSGEFKLLQCGVVSPPAHFEFNVRIGIISRELDLLLNSIRPKVTVVERVFLGKNTDSAFKLGHARGVAVASAMRAGSQVVEYTARSVKKGITGSGAASKEQVQLVLFAALGLRGQARADASDALALAFFHARNLQVQSVQELAR